MIRNQVLKISDTHLLPTITELYGLKDYKINVVEAHEGGRNLVYFCENEDKGDKIIRIAFLPDRNTEDFLSELEYVRYLYKHGGSVSNVVDSCNGRLLEEIIYKGHSFFVSVFEKAKGEQPECDEQLSYLIKCMEDEIPYEGFFHEIDSCV